MKIQSRLSNLFAKILILLFCLMFFAVLATISDPNQKKENSFKTVYHESQWNEYIPEVERATPNEQLIQSVSLRHIYGGVASHHIPTVIPKLFEFYTRLKKTQIVKNFIIIGPDHNDAGRMPITVSDASFFTSYGEIKPIAGLALELQSIGLVNIEEDPFDMEHSIGSQMLLIGKIFPGASVTPIILRSDTDKSQAEELGRVLALQLDEKTVLVASVDFSHYLSTDQAMPIDRISGEVIKNLDLKSLSLINVDSVPTMIAFVEAMNKKQATDTGDFTVLNTNDLMQNSDYTTGYIFGFWGIK